MKIVATQYNAQQKALEIYVGGCKRKCDGCHNPELQSFNIGKPYLEELYKIKDKIVEFDNVIDNIWLLGGEWLDQPIDEVIFFIQSLHNHNKKIWLFTGYDFKDMDDRLFSMVDYIKFGKYDKTQLTTNYECFGVKLASKNQYIMRTYNK